MKIFQKIVFLLLVGLILFGVRILLYEDLNFNNEDTEVLGHSSSWLYRKAIDIENEQEKILHEPEVMILLDTQNLISSGKLLENCNDIRFLDSDDSTLLRHRIESGCNTNETRVHVQLPTLTKEGTVIYFYYGNPYAPNLEYPKDNNLSQTENES